MQLTIGGEGASKLFLRATIRSLIKPDRHTVRLGLSFDGMERVFLQLSGNQWRYFNRRSAFRMGPLRSDGVRETVEFEFPGRRQPLVLPIHDLSRSGLSVTLPAGEPNEFPKGQPIGAKFELEVASASFDLVVRVVHESTIDGRIRVGFATDLDQTLHAEEQCDSVAEYVIERQRIALAGA